MNESAYSTDTITDGGDQASLLSEQNQEFIPNVDTSESQQATLLEHMPLVLEMVTNVLLSAQKAVGNTDTWPQETNLVFTPDTMLENQSMDGQPGGLTVEDAQVEETAHGEDATDVSIYRQITNDNPLEYKYMPIYLLRELCNLTR